MDKNSFLIYLDYEEQFNLLSDEEIGQLMRAIIKYEKTGNVEKLDGMVKMAFSFIKTQLDRDREKYNKKCERNKKNGAKGGRPKKETNEVELENKKPNGFEKSEWINQEPKKADNDNEDEDDNDILNKEKSKKRKTFDEVFSEKKVSEALKDTLKDFIDMRKTIKKPMTSKALELIINKLRKMSNSEQEQIDLLNESIEKGWQSVYPSNKSKTEKAEKKQNYNGYEQRQYSNLDQFYAN